MVCVIRLDLTFFYFVFFIHYYVVVPLSTFLRLIFVFVLRFLKAFRSRFVRLSRGLTNVASESSDFTSSK